MVERRPTPADTPDATSKNRVLHYIGLAAVACITIGLIVVLVNR